MKMDRFYQLQISPDGGRTWMDYETPSGLLITAQDLASFNQLPSNYRVRVVKLIVITTIIWEKSAKEARQEHPWKGDDK
jgi:hypothetical protein